MGISTKQVNYLTEVDALLSLVVTAVEDVKTGKSVAQIVGDLVPSFVSALSGIGDLKAELIDRKDLETTVAIKFADLINSLVG